MKKTFKELSGGATLNSEEMFALKGGVSAKSYGCETMFCASARFTCKTSEDAELGKQCSTAVCKSGAFSTCATSSYTIINPPVICTSNNVGTIIVPTP